MHVFDPHALLTRPILAQAVKCKTSAMSNRTREASHSGSWYTDNGKLLAQQLDGWLDDVPDTIKGIAAASSAQAEVKTGPVPGARVIIAP